MMDITKNKDNSVAFYIRVMGLILALLCANTAFAEPNWPTGPVKIILHTKAGGSSDVFMRTLAKSLEPQIGESVVVINSPGGGGASQLARLTSSAPDGQTLGINTLTHLTGMLTNLKGTFSKDDLSWIASTQKEAMLLFVRSDSDINNLNDMFEKIKETGEPINVGGFGPVGSMQNIGVSMLENAAETDLNWVAFNSTPDIIAALLGGHIDVGVSNLGATRQYFESDRIRGLGVLASERLDALPDMATFTEQGYNVDNNWVQVRGMIGPADMPIELQQKIADAFHQAMRTDEYQKFVKAAGFENSWMGPKEYSKFVYRISDVAESELKQAGVIE